MATKVYLDTNIVLDMIDVERKSHTQAVEVLDFCIRNNYMIYISEDIITTLFYIVKNKSIVLEFLKELVYVDWNIAAFGLDTLKTATDIALDKNLDLEDLLQCICAKKLGCSILITNDHQFYDCGIKIVNAAAFTSNKTSQRSS